MSQSSHRTFRAKVSDKLGRIKQIFSKKRQSSSELPRKISETGGKESIPAASSTEAEAHPPRPKIQPQANAVQERDSALETGVTSEVVEPMSNALADETVPKTSPSDGNNHSSSAVGLAEVAQSNGITRFSREADLKSDANTGNVVAIEPGVTNDDPWYSEKTPQWNQSVQIWKEQHPKDFEELKASADGKAGVEAEDWLSSHPAQQTSKQTAARLKRWQPVLASVRGIAMTAAAIDPHKIAPIVCASIFFGIDILFNCINPEDRDKILDVLCQCGDTIKECNAFEISFIKASHPAIATKMSKIQELLIQQYTTALKLAYKIRHACQIMQLDVAASDENTTPGKKIPLKQKFSDWSTRRGRLLWMKMSNEVPEWDVGLKELGRLKAEWAVRKDDLKESIAADAYTVEARDWLRKKGYPDPSPDDIKDRVMPDDRYSDGANWFLTSDAYNAFCTSFRPSVVPDTGVQDSVLDADVAKRVLWLRGGYGTGKTTLLFLTFAALSTDVEATSSGGSDLRIIPYFCNTAGIETKRADCETIVRAMIRRMASQPDFTLAKAAIDFYNEHKSLSAYDGDLKLEKHWKPLFNKVVASGTSRCHFVFLVDALDECVNTVEWEKFLRFMSSILEMNANVSFICSSHAHVNVSNFFKAKQQHAQDTIVECVDMTADRTRIPMELFIDGELERRKDIAVHSVFYNDDATELMKELRLTLVKHARGMFMWVKIWLNILVPVEDLDRRTIRSDTEAQKLLHALRNDARPSNDDYDQLFSGYQRLWDITCIRGGDDFKLRTRLFRFVLSAFEAPTIEALSSALRVRKDFYDRYPQPQDVVRLCSNFLTLGLFSRIQFVHSSADRFVRALNMDEAHLTEDDQEKSFSNQHNHLSIAKLYVDVLRTSNHPFWAAHGFNLTDWRKYNQHRQEDSRFRETINGFEDLAEWHHPLVLYLVTYGLTHCTLAAKKQSTSDPIWRSVIDHLIMSPESALGCVLLCNDTSFYLTLKPRIFDTSLLYRPYLDGRSFLRMEDGQLTLLPSHIFACLRVSDEHDSVPMQTASRSNKASECRDILEHMAEIGGNFSEPQGLRPFDYEQPREASALQLACVSGNKLVVQAILRAAKLRSQETLREILGMTTQSYEHPFCIAIEGHNVEIAAIILEYSRQPAKNLSPVEDSNGTEVYTSAEWMNPSSQKASMFDFNPFDAQQAIIHAIAKFQDNDLCRLFIIAGPEDIDAKYGATNRTILHEAVLESKNRLARLLVEIYGADIRVQDDDGKSALEYARENDSVLASTLENISDTRSSKLR